MLINYSEYQLRSYFVNRICKRIEDLDVVEEAWQNGNVLSAILSMTKIRKKKDFEIWVQDGFVLSVELLSQLLLEIVAKKKKKL